ncbi:unnamed protein product [Phytophthora fragariaefolia]|uniref:Unnamed protein product n=1 Tax=Phytophthora fragariaefolia TaxID=1490495 RepID=A0A9W7D0X6_9STRA|nr:unnamed protein product [Phytophthora fragariaefolia]
MDLKTDHPADRRGHCHILTIVDHAANYNQVCLLHTKDEAFDNFKRFATQFQRQFDVVIKVIRTDGGGEFVNRNSRSVPEDFGRPIPAGVLRRVFGRRHTARTEEFQLPKSFIDAFAGPAYVLLTIRASDHIKEPKTLGEAMRSKYWRKWKEAMDKELADLQANGTWKLVDCDGGRTHLLKLSSLRLIVLLAALWKAKLLQGDVPNAYLKSPLDKPIYLTPPNGTTGGSAGQSWLLLKGLYGLKQSGKLWNDMIDAFLKAEGFTSSKVDPCIYFMHRDGNLCVLGLYVDDVLVVIQDDNLSEHVMSRLAERFNTKNLGGWAKHVSVTPVQVRQRSGPQQQDVVYSDANWAGDSNSAKSTSGAVLQINSMTVSWASPKQTTVALSTMEAEYVAACTAVQDCIGISQLLCELRLLPEGVSILLRVDNQSAIKFMQNAVSSQRTRPLNIKYHFVRDAFMRKDVHVEYCPTQQHLADLFTKATDRVIFERLRCKLRLTNHA